MAMRDIRDDLRDRLTEMDVEMAELATRLDSLRQRRVLYEQALAMEDERYPTLPLPPPVSALPDGRQLQDFILGLLRVRPRTKDEIRDLADQNHYFNRGESGSP